MSKKLPKDELTVRTIVRSVVGLCLFLFLLCGWVIKPSGMTDPFSSENLWEALHPYHWLFDTVGFVGFVAFALYIAGWLGKVVYTFTEPKAENSSGLINAVAAAGFLSIFLMFA